MHFFLDDYKFEVMWNDPEPRLEKLRQYKGVLSPQFSTYYTMPTALQLYNTFRSRWCGAYLQSKGITVIPTVSWGKPESFWYCFDGIEEGSVVAVSTLGVKTEKDFFLQGYNEMLRRIKPEAIICYSKPFEEMEGNVIPIDYAETNIIKLFYVHKITPQAGYYEKADPNTLYIEAHGYVLTAGMGGGGGGNNRIGSDGIAGDMENGHKMPEFPGYDPTKPPGKDFEWRGKGTPEDGRGNWYNPKTKESFHADLKHPEPIVPHWDYKFPSGHDRGYRIYPYKIYEFKEFEMEDIYYG